MVVDWIKWYSNFGLELTEGSGNELIGTCPFTSKPGKFYVNADNGLWDSKVAGQSGNHFTYLRVLYRALLDQTLASELIPLAEHRQLPVEAFVGTVVFNHVTEEFLIPARNQKGEIVDLCRWAPGFSGIMRSPGSEIYPVFFEELCMAKPESQVYVCEGEWDAIALRWLVNKTGTDAVVVGMPGATVFKPAWVPIFRDRKVTLCYDNDKAGVSGETKAATLLRGVAQSLTFIEWPEGYPDKYDVRDLIVDGFAKVPFDFRKAPKVMQIIERMTSSLFSRTEKEKREEDKAKKEEKEEKEEQLPPPTLAEVREAYGKWLKMTSVDPIIYLAGVCFANRLSGDPVWAFLVAPPGGSKTELLMTLTESDQVVTTTTLTSASLISGMRMPGGEDPSLIPKLDGKVLVIKDFTSILSMNAFERDEIFGILRDCYDGYTEKMFGNGVHRKYESSFGILAGVTSYIDAVQAMNTTMGERYIKMRLDKHITPETEEDRLMRVLSNVSKEAEMRAELKKMGKRILSKKMPSELPTFDEHKKRIMFLAMLTAQLRGAVSVDKYTREMITRPTREIATRLTKVYSKLAIGMAVFLDHVKVGETEMRVLKQVALDTIPEMVLEIFEVGLELTRKRGKFCLADILDRVRTTDSTARKIISDMELLSIADKVKGEERVRAWWKISDRLIELSDGCGI